METIDTPYNQWTFDQYKLLHVVREHWCRSRIRTPDRADAVIELDGNLITDIPSFYLALGKAVNGPNGYFGACLDSLDDCMCGGFGLKSPFTLRINNSHRVRDSLDYLAIRDSLQIRLQKYKEIGYDDVDMIESTKECLIAVPIEKPNYLDRLLEIFGHHGVTVVLDESCDQS